MATKPSPDLGIEIVNGTTYVWLRPSFKRELFAAMMAGPMWKSETDLWIHNCESEPDTEGPTFSDTSPSIVQFADALIAALGAPDAV